MKTTKMTFSIAALASLAGCAGEEPQTKAPAPRSSTPVVISTVAAFEGLPQEGMWKCDPAFGDVNGDGFLDLAAIPRKGSGPHVWLGDGAGRWTLSRAGLETDEPSCGGGLEFADVNKDSKLDLVVADHCKGLFVYLGDGKGTWEPVTKALFPVELVSKETRTEFFTGAEDIAVMDVNEDGWLDMIAGASDEGGLSIYYGDGTGRNWTRIASALPAEGWANRLEAADVNSDGTLDLIASHSDGPRVWLHQGSELIASSKGLPSPVMRGLYTGIAAGDVNGDGRVDLATANWVDGPEVYLQQIDGSWQKVPDVFPEMHGGAIGLDLGRIDLDPHPDLVVSGRMKLEGGFVRGVFVLRGDGKGGFEWLDNAGLPATGLSNTPGVALGDVDGDGILDVAACSGLIVEMNQGRPSIPSRMLVWCTRLPDGATAKAKGKANNREMTLAE